VTGTVTPPRVAPTQNDTHAATPRVGATPTTVPTSPRAQEPGKVPRALGSNMQEGPNWATNIQLGRTRSKPNHSASNAQTSSAITKQQQANLHKLGNQRGRRSQTTAGYTNVIDQIERQEYANNIHLIDWTTIPMQSLTKQLASNWNTASPSNTQNTELFGPHQPPTSLDDYPEASEGESPGQTQCFLSINTSSHKDAR
jgi:hypothetical protein